MAASGHRLARFARPVDNPAGQADGQAAPAHELAHRDCPPAPQPSPTYPPAPTARPSALLHQVLIFSGGKSLRPSACALRLPGAAAGSRGWCGPQPAGRGHGPLTRPERPQPQPGSRRRAQPAPCSRGVWGKTPRGGPARRGLVKPAGREGGDRAPPSGGHLDREGEPPRSGGGTPEGCPSLGHQRTRYRPIFKIL
jgi:hypothetical protein